MSVRIFAASCVVTALLLGSAAMAQSPGAPPPAPTGKVTVLTIVDVVPDYAISGNVEKSAGLLKQLAQETQGSPGLISFKVLRDANRDNHFVIEGVWKDMKSFALYSGAAATRAFRTAFQPGAGGPFDERVYTDFAPSP